MNLRPKGSSVGEAGFSLVELLVAFVMLSVVMTALAPAFYSTLKAAKVSSQRSQATGLAVSATEQMRSLPYNDVGYLTTPGGCVGNNPVLLSEAGPLDAMPSTQIVGGTSYTVLRCVYWADSSIPADTEAYKQTQVLVSWSSQVGSESVSQTSALYAGGQGGYPGPAGGTTTTTTTVPGNPIGPLTCSANPDSGNQSAYIDVSWSVPSPIPAYYVVYYSATNPNGLPISGGANPYTVSPDEYGTTAELSVGASTTYWFQVEAVSSSGQYSTPSDTCSATTQAPTTTTTTPSSSYTSAAEAQTVNLNLGGGSTSYSVSNPPTQATNNGTGSNAPVTNKPTVSIPGSDNFVQAGAATEIAEANTNGTSYACAGIVSGAGSLGGGGPSSACTISGNNSGAVTLNLLGLPGVSTVIGSLVSSLKLNFDSVASWAAGSAGGTSFTGNATLLNGSVTIKPAVGSTVSIPLTLASPLTAPTDLVKALTAAIAGNAGVSSLSATLQTDLASVISMTGDYQSQSGATFSVSAIHIQVLGGGRTGDLAISTAGPNLPVGIAPCTINSLEVSPSAGTNGAGVALTAVGTLADESSFNLSVNVSSACSAVTVGYAPSGCTPGAASCLTQYAAMTGSTGTLYGTAGGPATLWSVGTTTFTVFTGNPPVAYSPLTQQQVILCTEKGNSGKC